MAKPPLRLQTTTLWTYPSQHFDERHEGQHQGYRGATPDYILWNLLSRYTQPKDLVVDPMCGSGTTVVVAREMRRRGLGYDLQPAHPEVFRADARKLPLETGKADFCFVDPPYSDHIRYSGLEECLGELSALDPRYYSALDQVFDEMIRVLRPERYLAVYVHDSFEKGKPFMPIGYRIFEQLSRRLVPVDAVAIVRNNRTLLRNHFHTAAVEHNYYLRGFGHLLVFYKPSARHPLPVDRRDPKERQQQLDAFSVNRAPGESQHVQYQRHGAPDPQHAHDDRRASEKRHQDGLANPGEPDPQHVHDQPQHGSDRRPTRDKHHVHDQPHPARDKHHVHDPSRHGPDQRHAPDKRRQARGREALKSSPRGPKRPA